MKFLEEQRVELGLHKSKTSGLREKRKVTMEFGIVLDGQKVSRITTFIAEAWKGMKKVGSGVCLVELERSVDSQNVRFYTLPKDEDATNEVTLSMEAVDLYELRLEKHQSGTISLFFKVVQPIGKSLWDWLFAAEQAETVYAEFQECQAELLGNEARATIELSDGTKATFKVQ